jgi:hypothetical protein
VLSLKLERDKKKPKQLQKNELKLLCSKALVYLEAVELRTVRLLSIKSETGVTAAGWEGAAVPALAPVNLLADWAGLVDIEVLDTQTKLL